MTRKKKIYMGKNRSVNTNTSHAHIQTTIDYLHVARSNPQRAFSPLDTLFEQCGKKK
jgi:hypothetical protein